MSISLLSAARSGASLAFVHCLDSTGCDLAALLDQRLAKSLRSGHGLPPGVAIPQEPEGGVDRELVRADGVDFFPAHWERDGSPRANARAVGSNH